MSPIPVPAEVNAVKYVSPAAHFGPKGEFTLLKFTINKTGRGKKKFESDPALPKLHIPSSDPWDTEDLFRLLDWRAGLSAFSGREAEVSELTDFMNDDADVLLKVVVGEGGSGKSRLGGEFGKLWSEDHSGWEAGFVGWRVSPLTSPVKPVRCC